ncbi:FAD-dependent oxidoreductase [Sphingomonas sp. TF3]|uniref:FAD-dependent oxidoreductase n=1 Tax=Sphingomonas sp. TF3 TaxID=2495580 RepID=UPI000F88E19C|nr:FAD-dependent oxidoreductase [Sphingomonas sp. TF3]RUN74620.1 FAD-dependent oxidoreductase [Sphingomonas sp. TF3]
MQGLNILIIGGGIGGLTSAIALRRGGHRVTILEKDPSWSVYGVGIIQQSNVLRAMDGLGMLDDYLKAGFAFDRVDVFSLTGACVAQLASPKLVDDYPANVGIGRRALQKVLADRALEAGTQIRLGVTALDFKDGEDGIFVGMSDGTQEGFNLVIGADGLYSPTRQTIFPEAPMPRFTGQSVWRYNFPKPADLDCLHAYDGDTAVGLVPLSDDVMYMYVTSTEPGNPRYDRVGMARVMRDRLKGHAPQVEALAAQIIDDDGVVYRPLEYIFVEGDWHMGRVVLLGDAVHATTPHLGQGAGMAIEDSVVLAEELGRATTLDAALRSYRDRRFERCKYIVETSAAISLGQIGLGPRIDQISATSDMYRVIAQPI